MKITDLQQAVRALNAAKFQELIHEIVEKEYLNFYPFEINQTGKTVGKETTSKGTPDIWFTLKNDKDEYFLIEATTQQKNLFGEKGKIQSDIEKCKIKIEQNNLTNVSIIYALTENVNLDEKIRLDNFCKSFHCNLALYSLDTICSLIKLHYPDMLKTYFNIDTLKGNVKSIDDFKKNNTFGVTQDNVFKYRENEKQQIVQELFSKKFVLLYGVAGCGKTRLALEIAEQLKNKENFETYIVTLCNINIIDDLINVSSNNKKILIIIDDANRQKFVVDALNFAQGKENLYFILTVRNYAVENIKMQLKSFNIEPMQISPLTNDQIKEIIKEGFGIKNERYLDYILNIAKGNLRFAVMSAEVIKRENKKSTSIAQLMEDYYHEVIADLKITSDDGFNNYLVSISFLKSIDVRDYQKVKTLSQVFKFDESKFDEYSVIAEEKELINYHFDKNVIEIADQILADLFFYRFVFEYNRINICDIFSIYHRENKNKFIDAIQSALNVYGLDANIKKQLTKLNDVIKSFDEDVQLDFYEMFYNIFQEDTLDYCYNSLAKYNGADIEYAKYGSQYDVNTRKACLISYLINDKDYYYKAVKYIFELYKLKSNQRQAIREIINHNFKISQSSFSNNYVSEILIFENALSINDDSEDFYKLLYILINNYYPLTNEVTESHKNKVSFYKITYYANDAFKKFRGLFWQSFEKLFYAKYHFDVQKLLYKNAYSSGNNYDLRKIDFSYALSIYNKIDKSNLFNKIFCFDLMLPYRKMQEGSKIFTYLVDDNAMILYRDYICEITSKRYYGEELNKNIKNVLCNYQSWEKMFADLSALEKNCLESYSWQLSEIINQAFLLINQQCHDDYEKLLYYFLGLNPDTVCQPINIIANCHNKKKLQSFISGSNMKYKYNWQAQLYLSLQDNEIDDYFYTAALDFFINQYYKTSFSWGNEQLLNLDKFEKYKQGFLSKILNEILNDEKFKYHFVSTLFSLNYSIEELLVLFQKDINLLIKAYFYIWENGEHCDYEGKFARYISELDSENLYRLLKIKIDQQNEFLDITKLFDLKDFSICFVKCLEETKWLNLSFIAGKIIETLPENLYMELIDVFIKRNRENKNRLFDFSCIIKERGNQANLNFLDCLIKNEVDIDTLQRLQILNGPSSWSGSQVPYLNEGLALLTQYIESNQVDKNYLVYLNKLKDHIIDLIKNVEIFEFNDDRFGD